MGDAVHAPAQRRRLDRSALAELRDSLRRGDTASDIRSVTADRALDQPQAHVDRGRLTPDATITTTMRGRPQAPLPDRAEITGTARDAHLIGQPAARSAKGPPGMGVAGADLSPSENAARAWPDAITDGSRDPLDLAASAALPTQSSSAATIPSAGRRRDPLPLATPNGGGETNVSAAGPVTTPRQINPIVVPNRGRTRVPDAAPMARGIAGLDDGSTALSEALWRLGIDPS